MFDYSIAFFSCQIKRAVSVRLIDLKPVIVDYIFIINRVKIITLSLQEPKLY